MNIVFDIQESICSDYMYPVIFTIVFHLDTSLYYIHFVNACTSIVYKLCYISYQCKNSFFQEITYLQRYLSNSVHRHKIQNIYMPSIIHEQLSCYTFVCLLSVTTVMSLCLLNFELTASSTASVTSRFRVSMFRSTGT